jgi:hypothetical protein
LAQVFDDLGNCFWAVTEWSIVGYAGLFEVFVRCWLLNYLLAKVEGQGEGALSPSEHRLALQLSPLRTKGVAPTLPMIWSGVPLVRDMLQQIPHVRTDPRTGQEASSPVTEALNALRTIEFWREYRNLMVHGAGMISLRFYGKHHQFVEELRALMPEISPLAVGQRIQLRDDSFRAMSSVHYHAARRMNEELNTLSAGRRGHPHAPSPTPSLPFAEVPARAAPLLVDGDHAPSYQWTIDPGFRLTIRQALVGPPDSALQPTGAA